MGAGEAQMVAQKLGEQGARLDVCAALLAVHGQRYFAFQETLLRACAKQRC
jgi:hypothetical protein